MLSCDGDCATISSAQAGDRTSSRERHYVNPPEPGWYRDPYFKNRERYWDGEVWTDECRLIQPALPAGHTRHDA